MIFSQHGCYEREEWVYDQHACQECKGQNRQLQDFTNPLDPESHAVDCGNGLTGYNGTLIMDGGESATLANGANSITLVEVYDTDPKVIYILIDDVPYEIEVGDIIPLDGFQVEVIRIHEDGRAEVKVTERTD